MNDQHRREQLSRELRAWFDGQSQWQTRKAFAGEVRLAYSSVKDYFSGQAWPKPEARKKLYAVTGIPCLGPAGDSPLFSPPQAQPATGPGEGLGHDRGSSEAPVLGGEAERSPPSPSTDGSDQGRLIAKEAANGEPEKTLRIAVSGDVTLRRLEVALVDTREFQRLRSIKQLGTSYLVYPSATHTRFEHALGTLSESNRIVRHIGENPESSGEQKTVVSQHERLIRLAALLHDVTHVPFGHTLEDETKAIPRRHDEDPERRRYLVDESAIGKKLMAEIGRGEFELLMRIMEAKNDEVEKLGEFAYISDIVNNTLCADLLDYLKRDVYFCNLQDSFGERFLRYLYLDYVPTEEEAPGDKPARRLVVRLWKKDASRHRRDVLSELVDLLRVRYSLGEKVYFHHAKKSSSAMIGRAVWSAMHLQRGPALKLDQLYGIGDEQLLAHLGESQDPVASKLATRLLRRDLYKCAYTLNWSEAQAMRAVNWTQKMVAEFHDDPTNRTRVEDNLADLCGLKAGDVLVYCPALDMGKKHARMLVEWKGEYKMLQEIDDPATEPALKAILKSHDLLWALHVFVVSSANDTRNALHTLRDLCSARFAPTDRPEDLERRLEPVLRTLVNRRIAERGKVQVQQAEKVVETLVSKHRSGSHGDVTSAEIDQAIDENCGE